MARQPPQSNPEPSQTAQAWLPWLFSSHRQMFFPQRAVSTGNVTVPQLLITGLGWKWCSVPHCQWRVHPSERCCFVLQGLEQLEGGEECLEGGACPVSVSSGTAGSRSAHLSAASLRSLSRSSLGQHLWPLSWPSARGRALLGIFQPHYCLLHAILAVPSSIDLKNSNSCFAF